jgi:tetratricopeptide (TPR) repeat protein
MKRTALWGIGILAAVSIGAVWPAVAEEGPPRTAMLYRESYQLEASRDPSGALSRMKEIMSRGDKSYFAVVRSAWLSYLSGDFTAAENGYREAAVLAPKALEPKLGLTLPLLAAKKWRDLERACRDVLTADPNHATARTRLAHALYMQGNYPDAASLYRRLLEEYPGELDHQTALAWAYLKMGRRAEARTMFSAVLAVSPDNPNAKQGLSAP